MDASLWRFLRLRPANFPHIRIAQLACLYHRAYGLLSRIMETETLQGVRDILKGGTSEYWLTHYTFGGSSPSRPKTLSNTSLDLLIINTVVTFLYAYGLHKGNRVLCARAGSFLEELKAENNYITRMWEQCGMKASNAADSQALIQLKKEYCDKKIDKSSFHIYPLMWIYSNIERFKTVVKNVKIHSRHSIIFALTARLYLIYYYR